MQAMAALMAPSFIRAELASNDHTGQRPGKWPVLSLLRYKLYAAACRISAPSWLAQGGAAGQARHLMPITQLPKGCGLTSRQLPASQLLALRECIRSQRSTRSPASHCLAPRRARQQAAPSAQASATMEAPSEKQAARKKQSYASMMTGDELDEEYGNDTAGQPKGRRGGET